MQQPPFTYTKFLHGSPAGPLSSVAAQRALATTLLELPAHGASIGGDIPELPDLLADDRWQTPAGPSRMPAA